MCDSEVVDLTLLDSAKRAACELWPGDDAVARALYADERDYDIEAKVHRYAGPGPRGGGDSYMHPHFCEAVARRFPKPGAVVAETRAPTVLGRGGGKKTVLQQRTEKLSLYPEWLRDPKSTRPFRYSLQIREQRQRRGCVAAKLAPEAQRKAPGPS